MAVYAISPQEFSLFWLAEGGVAKALWKLVLQLQPQQDGPVIVDLTGSLVHVPNLLPHLDWAAPLHLGGWVQHETPPHQMIDHLAQTQIHQQHPLLEQHATGHPMVQPYFCMTKEKESYSTTQTQARCTQIPGTVALKYSMVPPEARLDRRPVQEAEKDPLGTFSGCAGND